MSRLTCILRLLIVTTIVVLFGLDGSHAYPRKLESKFFSVRDESGRLRRGFQPLALATARGFGKRSDSNLLPSTPQDWTPDNDFGAAELGDLVGNEHKYRGDRVQRRYGAAWIAQQMASHPQLAYAFVNQYLDTNQDGIVTEDELTSSE